MYSFLNDDDTHNIYDKTPTQQHFSTLDGFEPLIKASRRNKSAQDVISILPKKVQLVRRILLQLNRLREREVMLVWAFV
jgi:hypothetical protein